MRKAIHLELEQGRARLEHNEKELNERVLTDKKKHEQQLEALEPLVTENPAVAHAIAEGALMRLEAGRRCFERYRRELQVPAAIDGHFRLASGA